MDNGLIPHRYAKALYEFALERHDQAAVYEAMKAVIDNFEAVPGLQKAMANPFMPKEEKEKLVFEAAGSPAADKGGDTLTDFVKLLAKNNRLDLVMWMAFAYRDIYRQENSIYLVTITSAMPLGEADRKRLEQLVMSKLNGGTAEIKYLVDPDIIGGFIITVDNERLDASVRNELNELRQNLMK